MKRLALFLGFFVLSLGAMAQLEMKTESFTEVVGFVNITDKQSDINGTPYAVIKVRTENINDKERRRLNFDGGANAFLELEYKDGEVWVYITHLASRLNISHPDYGSVAVDIPIEMAPKKGYEMILIRKVEVVAGWGSLTVTTLPEDGAQISLNGKVLKTLTPYTNNMIAAGTYEVTVSKENYRTVTKMVEIHTGENIIAIEMPAICGKVKVTSQPAGATVYIDNIKYGVTPCNIDVITGQHVMHVIKEGWITAAKKFAIKENEQLTSDIVLAKCPEGAVNAVFTINRLYKVVFSKGNIQYQPSTRTWRFAEHQYDFIGEGNNNISNSYDGWIDLFGWGTGHNPTKVSTNDADYQSFDDWGYNAISNGGNGLNQWFTLLVWNDVLYNRETLSGIRFAKATVNDVKGLILLPDNWRAETYALKQTDDRSANYNTNVISLSDWENIFETFGAVFLPEAGSRNYNNFYGHEGRYWTVSSWTNEQKGVYQGHNLVFTKNDQSAVQSTVRHYGLSVRVVQDVNNLIADGTYSYDISEKRMRGKVKITTNPSGATVYIDDKVCGVTPCVVDEISPGYHELMVVKPLYKVVKKQFVVEKNDLFGYNEVLEKGIDGIINSEFSVSPTKKVNFSKGNLQYQTSTNTWRFAEHQWDKADHNDANSSATDKGVRDLFGWGTGANPMNTSDNTKDYARFTDWGKNAIINGGNMANCWRTPTKDEWLYLLEQRKTKSGMRYVKAKVNNVNGMILLPDSWDKKTYKLKGANKPKTEYKDNIISADDWITVFEANGAVFLLDFCHRYVMRYPNPKVPCKINISPGSNYWSSTATPGDADRAYCISLSISSFEYATHREHGFYVRLVHDAE